MSNLINNSLIYNLSNFYDRHKPDKVPAKLQEMIAFIRNNADGYEDIDEVIELLHGIKEAFEESLIEKQTWGLCLSNKARGYSISIGPINKSLDAANHVSFANSVETVFQFLKIDIRKYCLDAKNIVQYNKLMDFLDELELVMNSDAIDI